MPGQETFPRSERLIRRKEFVDVYQHGDKQVGRGFICYVARQEGQGRKFGVAVSRKVGGAVTRNRVKRFIREAYRTSRKHLIDQFQMVVVARPGSASMTYHECREAIRQLFQRGEVLSE